MTTINNKLENLYSSKYKNLTEELLKINSKFKEDNRNYIQATNPLLIKVDEEYVNADIKIMFFGQETNTWLGKLNDGAFLGKIEPLLDLYEDFFLEKSMFCL